VVNTPFAVVLADLNNDGNLDVVAPIAYADAVIVMLGRGDGTFQDPTSYSVGSQPVATILRGNGDGTFLASRRYPAGSFSPGFVVAGDFNNDQRTDLAVANDVYPYNMPSNVSILLGPGDGSFRLVNTFPVGPGQLTVAVADFNADGSLDLAVSNSVWPSRFDPGDVTVFLGNGDGTFHAPLTYPVGIGPGTPVVSDVNGDGKLDLVVANMGSDEISVLLGNGAGRSRGRRISLPLRVRRILLPAISMATAIPTWPS
jgi:hypothetical protein